MTFPATCILRYIFVIADATRNVRSPGLDSDAHGTVRSVSGTVRSVSDPCPTDVRLCVRSCPKTMSGPSVRNVRQCPINCPECPTTGTDQGSCGSGCRYGFRQRRNRNAIDGTQRNGTRLTYGGIKANQLTSCIYVHCR